MKKSDYFKAALRGTWLEQDSVRLEEDDPWSFDIFVYWLYHDSLSFDNTSDLPLQILAFYRLADRLLLPQCAKLSALDRLLQYFNDSCWEAPPLDFRPPSPDVIHTVLTELPSDCPMRRLAVDIAARLFLLRADPEHLRQWWEECFRLCSDAEIIDFLLEIRDAQISEDIVEILDYEKWHSGKLSIKTVPNWVPQDQGRGHEEAQEEGILKTTTYDATLKDFRSYRLVTSTSRTSRSEVERSIFRTESEDHLAGATSASMIEHIAVSISDSGMATQWLGSGQVCSGYLRAPKRGLAWAVAAAESIVWAKQLSHPDFLMKTELVQSKWRIGRLGLIYLLALRLPLARSSSPPGHASLHICYRSCLCGHPIVVQISGFVVPNICLKLSRHLSS